MKKVLFVFGTRPEAIKMCPLIREIKSRKMFKTIVCTTGQHQMMTKEILQMFGLSSDYDFTGIVQGMSLSEMTSVILIQIEQVLKKEKPDVVFVHGDTLSAFSAALGCFYQKIPVAHIEAGLRTYNMNAPYPEEFNRQAISLITSYHFAPTEQSRENLLKEGKDPKTIFVTGNTVIDALYTTVQKEYQHPELDWSMDSRLILLTVHRRENWGEALNRIFRAVVRIAENIPDVKVIYPVHMNPEIRKSAEKYLKNHSRIHMIEPLNVYDFHNFMARSYLILTDSGGIQEEAPSFGKPVLVMRESTERPEGLRAGVIKLVGTQEKEIYQQTKLLLEDETAYEKMSKRKNPYGDGKASQRIADQLELLLK